MSIPALAMGYGNASTARNVFRVVFSQALSSAVRYEMYDGGTYPAVGSGTTTANDCFAGTAGNSNKPMYSLVDTTNAAPTSSWLPASATGGSANPNRMKGQTNYVTQAGSNVIATGAITFNMVLEVPSDATTSSTMAADLLVRYTYTGTAPTLTWDVNDTGGGGTEGSPVWTAFVPGTNGIRHCKAGTIAAGPYLATIPASGVLASAVGVVTT